MGTSARVKIQIYLIVKCSAIYMPSLLTYLDTFSELFIFTCVNSAQTNENSRPTFYSCDVPGIGCSVSLHKMWTG